VQQIELHLARIARGAPLRFIVEVRRRQMPAFEPLTMRVRQGGHDVPPGVIRRRFASGMRNFLDVYKHRVDFWQWFDNSRPRPRLLEEGANR
jgi:predicted ABC-type ATPase